MSKKLQAKWSHKTIEDLHVYHSIDAERKLIDIMATEIAKDIDNEILNQFSAKKGFLTKKEPEYYGIVTVYDDNNIPSHVLNSKDL